MKTPKSNRDLVRTERESFTLTPLEKKRLEEVAFKNGFTKSSFLRKLMLDAFAKEGF